MVIETKGNQDEILVVNEHIRGIPNTGALLDLPDFIFSQVIFLIRRHYETVPLTEIKLFYSNSQERLDFVRLRSAPKLKELDGAPLYLFQPELQGAEHSISFDQLSCSEFGFTINTESAGTFLLRQMHDPRWRVYVNEKEKEIQRGEEFFMGVSLPAGGHTVRFVFSDMRFLFSLFLSLATLVTLLILSMRQRIAKRHSLFLPQLPI